LEREGNVARHASAQSHGHPNHLHNHLNAAIAIGTRSGSGNGQCKETQDPCGGAAAISSFLDDESLQ